MTGQLKLEGLYSTEVDYQLEYCHSDKVENLPFNGTKSENDICTFTRSETGVLIQCMNVEILNYVFSDESCESADWERYWASNGEATKLSVTGLDNLSGFYRVKPGKFFFFSF